MLGKIGMPTAETSSPRHAPILIAAGSLQGLLPGLVHGFSTNFPFGPNPSVAATLQSLVEERFNRRMPMPLMLEQPHAAEILATENGAVSRLPVVRRDGHGTFLKGYDGATASLAAPALLGVRAADCVPVLAVHPQCGAFAALHAGWRGTAAGILPNLLRAWREKGGALAGVRLAFGPGIRACCFAVRDDCLSRFQPGHLAGAVARVNGAQHLDLARVLTTQAVAGGLSPEQIEVLPYCTCCHENEAGHRPFASYRRSQKLGRRTDGRNAAFIGLPAEG